jgi:hypothetical protein
MTFQFPTDSAGNLLTKPLAGWAIRRLAEIAVGLKVDYPRNQAELERGESQSIEFLLTPEQCLLLAEALSTAAKRITGGPLPSGTPIH